MKRKSALIGLVFWGFLFSLLPGAQGQTQPGDEGLFTGVVKPNVLIVLDNSNSMDEDFFGNAVGSWDPDSKAAGGKRALNNLVNTYADPMRIGIMTYRLPTVQKYHIANTSYFVSYDPRSYCPTPVDACVEYCRTGDVAARIACQSACSPNNSQFDAAYIDDSISAFPYGAARNKYCALAYPKTNRMINPTDPTHYIYYRQALPYYSSSDEGTHFDVSSSYTANDNFPDTYSAYRVKTGTSDGTLDPANSGYSGFWQSGAYAPTDSDIALGYNEFGRRLAFTSVGRTWYANTSPGGGYLQVAVDNNQSNNKQRDKLLDKLKAYENDANGYMDTCTETDRNKCPYIISAGLTPTAGTLQTAISYFQGGLQQDGNTFATPIQATAADCQKSYIVYVTDGLPSVGESGAEGDADSLMPAVISRLQALRSLPVSLRGKTYTYDLRTYVVGMGLTSEAKARLDQMAVAAGTDIDGHAYYADSADELQEALNQIFSEIVSGTYSFSLPSVTSVRFQEENSLYAASFEPQGTEPFWKGQLQKIQIQTDGSLGNVIWEAGQVLEGTSETSRNIKTLINGALTNFTESIDPGYFGTSKTQERDQIVGYIRGKATLPSGSSQVSNPDSPRKLGDIFHANPVTISSPSLFFNDPRDQNRAFGVFRNNHQRTSSNGGRIIVAGANDGQLHAFETGGGTERWSFMPPNLLPKLNELAHVSHPTKKRHNYFVDGPVSAADVWWAATDNDGTQKQESDWKTLLVFGLGMGVRGPGEKSDYLWSKSSFCNGDFQGQDNQDGDFQGQDNQPHSNYCGYYALDLTNTGQFPKFQWILKPDKDEARYLGEPWSKMVMGRVRIDGNEKWVGFIGGGYTPGTSKNAKRGKGFFVVDLKDGNVLWSFTRKQNGAMSFIPGTAAIVDKDNDGFIDTAYVGDLAGNIWKFTFCPNDPLEPQKCGLADWKASILYSSQEGLPVFTTPAVAKDKNDFWVFWGTGEKAYPNFEVEGAQNKFFGLRDENLNTSCTLANLQNINSGVFDDSAKKGWYLSLSGQERVLSDAAVFKGIVFFTSYTPPVNQTNMCGATGVGALYGIAMLSLDIGGTPFSPGQGIFSSAGQRKIDLGAGIPSAPMVSQKPIDSGQKGGTPDVYLAVSGGSGLGTQIRTSATGLAGVAAALAGSSPSSYIIHWRDRRVQPY
jgi:type IV pilus assembly protein PilY1